MSLAEGTNKIQYVVTSATTAFSFPYKYWESTDLIVTVLDSGGTITTLVNGVGYTLAATNGDPSLGGEVTTTASYSSDTITIERIVPVSSGADFVQGDGLPPDALNEELDKATAQIQQLNEAITSQISHPSADPSGLNYEAPSVVSRASKALGYDASGNVVSLDLSSSGTVAADTTQGVNLTSNIISAKVDDSSVEFDVSGNISVKDSGIATALIADGAVTLSKHADIATAKVIGNMSGATATPLAISVLDEDNMASDSATSLATQQSIKAYADTVDTAAKSYAMQYSGATVFTGSMPAAFTDLDLSSTIGANRCFVHLSVIPDANDSILSFRINGETATVGDTVPLSGAGTSQGKIDSGNIAYFSLITDASGVVEWDSSGAGSGGTIVKVLAYQILQ